MLDVTTMSAGTLAKLLLAGDHDLLTEAPDENQYVSGEIDEAYDLDQVDGVREITVTYSGVYIDETSIFPCGRVTENSPMIPGENDKYRNDMVVVFNETFDDHVIIVTGGHSGAGISDDSYEAFFCGTIEIVPREKSEEMIAIVRKRHRRDVLDDVGSRLREITRTIEGYPIEELMGSGLWENLAEINRQIAAS